MSNNPKLKGKRCICIARASNAAEGTTSTEAQLKTLKAVMLESGMIHVDDIVLDGVTGSMPAKRTEIDTLLERKRTKDDYDVLLLQKVDRMTRSGTRHLFWMEHEFLKAGVQIVYASDDIPDGRFGNLYLTFKAEAAQETAMSISERSTQGYQRALENGNVATSTHTPFGCWRLYCRSDGTPSHIIRDLGDGRQQKLHPDTLEVIDTYGSIGGGSKGHYRKQKHELVFIIPGDPEKAAVARLVFYLRYIEGWKGKRIASHLNMQGIPSPRGKRWSQRQVESIYEQEIYTGRGVANRTSSAIYNERHPDAPKKVDLDPQVLANAKWIPVRHRPVDEWFIQKQPFMADFLEPAVRELAMREHEELWRRRNDPDRPRRKVTKHQASEYLLTGLFFALQDGEALVGHLSGPPDKKVRYYRHKKGMRGYEKGSHFNKMFRADALEPAVLAIVQEILLDRPLLKQQLKKFVVEQLEAESETSDVDELRRRRKEVEEEIQFKVAILNKKTLDVVKPQIDQLTNEIVSLDKQIAALEARQQWQDADPDELIEQAIERIMERATNIADLPAYALREFLATVIDRIEGDMATQEVKIYLKAPSWAFSGASEADGPMCLGTSSWSSTSSETQQGGVVHLAYADCRYEHVRGSTTTPPCYRCRRTRRAA